MKESVEYDRERKIVIHRVAWETVGEDGQIQHHYSERTETNRSKKYIRVFTGAFALATRALDKNACDALVYIMDKVSFSTNVASVSYSKMEKYLGISNKSVNRIFQVLQEKDLIRMVERGQWMLNPSLGAGCYEQAYERLVCEFNSLESYAAKQKRKKETIEDVSRDDDPQSV